MTDTNDQIDVMFYQLILSVQASVMQHLGKVMSPLTGKVERNLEAARYSIDMLEMLQRKTEGHLSEQEKRLVEHVLYELRLNYVEEVKQGGSSETPSAETPETGGETVH
jgi:hypothetical protein